MPRRRISSLVACALLACGVLSACSTDAPTPKPLTTPTPTASPSTSPSPSAARPPTLPAAARGHTDASARAFVRYWIDALDYSASKGKAATLRSASSSRCAACIAISNYIDRVHRAGGSIHGQGWTTMSSHIVKATSSGGRIVDAAVIVHPQVIVEKPGTRVLRYSGGRRHKKFWLAQSAGTWTVIYLEQPE